jgi:hypothetical protein
MEENYLSTNTDALYPTANPAINSSSFLIKSNIKHSLNFILSLHDAVFGNEMNVSKPQQSYYYYWIWNLDSTSRSNGVNKGWLRYGEQVVVWCKPTRIMLALVELEVLIQQMTIPKCLYPGTTTCPFVAGQTAAVPLEIMAWRKLAGFKVLPIFLRWNRGLSSVPVQVH